MTRQEIRALFGLVSRLLEPKQSKNHGGSAPRFINDDTEQNWIFSRPTATMVR